MPGRFKDYIAMPKANMYQSFHTTVIRLMVSLRRFRSAHESMKPVNMVWQLTGLIRIRKQVGNTDMEKFSWLRQIVQWRSELKDPDEFLEAVKVDLFDEEIFVFTPKGDVLSLPKNATALDFAFSVPQMSG